MSDVDWIIVFVNNASEDGMLDRVLQLRESDPRVKVITFGRTLFYIANRQVAVGNSRPWLTFVQRPKSFSITFARTSPCIVVIHNSPGCASKR